MKTRCKHILDVTDRYCVLTEEAESCHNPKLNDSKEDSLDSTDSTESSGSLKLHGNVVKTTVSSLSSHLAVIAKTYTKRHSSSNLNQTTWKRWEKNRHFFPQNICECDFFKTNQKARQWIVNVTNMVFKKVLKSLDINFELFYLVLLSFLGFFL